MDTFRQRLLLLMCVILASRIPFLFDGFGAEEDAWALPMVAERIATTGHYEVSRLPGHPVQELSYSMMYDAGPAVYNLVTALLATLGLAAFALMLKKFGHTSPLSVTAFTAFTPIVYINSTNALDYTWALALVLLAGYMLSHRRTVPAGILTGLAVGCRMTAGAMVLPYAVLLWMTTEKNIRGAMVLRFVITTLLSAAVVFLPVYLEYGIDFFTYYEHFPTPGLLKNGYKGMLGVWGLPGTVALAIALLLIVRKKSTLPTAANLPANTRALYWCSVLTVLLYVISFLRLPLKSAFMIPLVPFALLALSLLLDGKAFRITGLAIAVSCFFFGINLAEAHRGSAVSPVAWVTRAGGQTIAIDPLNGLVTADRSKRRQRTAYAKAVMKKTATLQGKHFIIAGWWLADLQYLSRDTPPGDVLYRYYTDEPELQWYRQQGYTIYYLDDQATYNDLRFRKKFTERYAQKLPEE